MLKFLISLIKIPKIYATLRKDRISNNIPGYANFTHTVNRMSMKHSYRKNSTTKKYAMSS